MTTTSPPGVRWPARLVFAAAGVILALALAEAALRVAGFHFDLAPALQFGWPDPATITEAYRPDPDLLWVTRDYHDVLRAARRLHPAVVFMGDSCTEFGSYPARTIERLKADASSLTSGVKLGVGGWSSEQGVAQLRRDVVPLHPKVVTVYYGWNDHWVAMGLTDPEIARAHRLRSLAAWSRVVQLWLRLKVNMAAKRRPPPNRVPLAQYEDNLRSIAHQAESAGIAPVFITAPSNHIAGREPAYLARRHVRSLAELVPLHNAYVEATRRVAHETGAALCDAAATFAALPQPHDGYFKADGIHLTDTGNEEMATVVSECLRRGELQHPAHVVTQRR